MGWRKRLEISGSIILAKIRLRSEHAGIATFKLIFKEGSAGGGPAARSSVPAGTANLAALPAGFSFTITVATTADLIKSMFWDPTLGTTLDEFKATRGTLHHQGRWSGRRQI
jgi:hypothetical protein